MSYPSIEQYQEVLQNAKTAFVDPELARGTIQTSGTLGTPAVVSGGFALTYGVKVAGARYAVRCFHRPAAALARRYAAVSRTLRSLGSDYFVEFEYQDQGIRANGGVYPIVKMAWAAGVTLGEFVEAHHGNVNHLTNLRRSLGKLAADLERMGIAHGDIQEGNMMVEDAGRRVRLIDYDGMFVPELAAMGSAELGHRDYQHPRRDSTQYDARLDRFSFITLDLALRALCERPSVWNSSQSGQGVVVFKANDFADPAASATLSEVSLISSLQIDAQNFARVCQGGFAEVPTLAAFLAGKGIARQAIRLDGAAQVREQMVGYISQHLVVSGSNYAEFAKHIGGMVELIGCVTQVRVMKNKLGKPMVFINLGAYPGCVSLTVWSDALATAGEQPSTTWHGRWISVRGLVEPPSQKQKNPAAFVSVKRLAQITQLTEQVANYRLAGPSSGRQKQAESKPSNAQRLAEMSNVGAQRARSRPSSPPMTLAPRSPPVPSPSANQRILQAIRQPAATSAGAPAPFTHTGAPAPSASPSPTSRPASLRPRYMPVPPKVPKRSVPGWVWVALILVGWVLLSLVKK